MQHGTVVRKISGLAQYRAQSARPGQRDRVRGAQVQREVITTPGTRVRWASLQEWVAGWKRLNARAASSKRHQQRAAHVAELASNMSVVNRETDLATLAAVKHLIERENILPPRGMREGHPATEILQRVGTVLGERRRAAAESVFQGDASQIRWKAAA